jgi:hypothetical protein
MKKLTLIKLVFVVASAVALYGQATSGPTPDVCPPFCFHLTCGNGRHAHCSNGQCVCP